MNELASSPAVLSDDVAVLPVAEVAQMLAVPVSRVHQMVRDGQLLSVRRDGAVSQVVVEFGNGTRYQPVLVVDRPAQPQQDL